MNPSRDSATNPTARLDTPDVGGVRPEPRADLTVSPRPVPRSQGTQRGDSSPLGCDPKSVRAEGPSSSSSLDSSKHNRNSFCGKYSVVGKIEYKGKWFRHIARLGCKAWTCPVCGPKKASRLRQAIIQVATRRKMCRFLTLTLNPRHCTAKGSVKYIKECWGKFRVYLGRKNCGSIDYIWILELQKSGYAHLHILVDRYIHQSWIKKSWQSVGGGEIADIRRVDIHNISSYMSKYLTKDIILADYEPGTRRYSTSRSIKLFERAIKGAWEILRKSIDDLRPMPGLQIAEMKCDYDGVLQWFRIEIAQNA